MISHPAQVTQLAAILGRLGSEFAGERDAAALMATRWIRSRNLAWEDVLRPALPSPERHAPDGQAAPRGWRTDVELCGRHTGSLRPWEQDFIGNLARQATISRKQRDILAEIAQRLRNGGAQ